MKKSNQVLVSFVYYFASCTLWPCIFYHKELKVLHEGHKNYTRFI
jgi:hypothetical protein